MKNDIPRTHAGVHALLIYLEPAGVHLYSSSAGVHALLLRVSCSALLVAPVPMLLIYLEPVRLLAFSLVVSS